MTAPRPEDAGRDIEAVLFRQQGPYRYTATALAEITGHRVAVVIDELENLKASGKVRQDGSRWSWVHSR